MLLQRVGFGPDAMTAREALEIATLGGEVDVFVSPGVFRRLMDKRAAEVRQAIRQAGQGNRRELHCHDQRHHRQL